MIEVTREVRPESMFPKAKNYPVEDTVLELGK